MCDVSNTWHSAVLLCLWKHLGVKRRSDTLSMCWTVVKYEYQLSLSHTSQVQISSCSTPHQLWNSYVGQNCFTIPQHNFSVGNLLFFTAIFDIPHMRPTEFMVLASCPVLVVKIFAFLIFFWAADIIFVLLLVLLARCMRNLTTLFTDSQFTNTTRSN